MIPSPSLQSNDLNNAVTLVNSQPPTADVMVLVDWAQIDGGRLGGEFNIWLSIYNAGPAISPNVLLTNRLPGALTVRNRGSAGGENSCPPINGEWICDMGGFFPGGGYLTIINGTVPRAGTYTNFISLGGPLHDGNLSNNSAIVVFTVAPPQPTVTVTAPEGVGENASSITFTISLAVPSPDLVSLDYYTTNGTALAGQDYVSTAGTLVFAPGVTNLTVEVPLLEDSLYEGSETFNLVLNDSVNGQPPSAQAIILDNDEPPVLFADPLVVNETDEPLSTVWLKFSLTSTSSLPVSVDWITWNGLADSVTDYVSTNATTVILPGQESVFVPLFIRGDTIFEDEEYFVVFDTGISGATMEQGDIPITIRDNDAVRGRFDHFLFSPVPSPRLVGRPFSITVQAVDAFDEVITNYNAAVQPLLNVDLWGIQPMGSNFSQGIWTGSVIVSENTSSKTVTADDTILHVGRSNPFEMLMQPMFSLSLPSQSVEGADLLIDAGRIEIEFPFDDPVIFRLTSSLINKLVLPEFILLPARETNVSFDLFVQDNLLLDASTSVSITAEALGFTSSSATLVVHDNESASFDWELPTEMLEGADEVAVRLTVSEPPSVPVNVSLTTTLNRVSMPPSVEFGVGQTSLLFNVRIPDDQILQGSERIEFRAHVENWVEGVSTTTILDNESTNMIVRLLPPSLWREGQGNGNLVRVIFGGTLNSNVVVSVTSSDTTELLAPKESEAISGRSGVAIPVEIIDDSQRDGNQTVTITVSAPGFLPVSTNVVIGDNDADHFSFAAIPNPPLMLSPTSGVPFTVTFSTRDVNDTNIPVVFDSPVTLAAIGPQGSINLSRTNLSASDSHGVWTSQVTFFGWGSNVVLSATSTNGVTGRSSAFNIMPPPWSQSLRITNISCSELEVRAIFETRVGFKYQMERTEDLQNPVWLSIGSPVVATSRRLSLSDTNWKAHGQSFYRLSLVP